MEMKVYDWEGTKRDLAYLKSRYGDFSIHIAASGIGPVYRVAVLRERVNTNAALVITVRDKDGVAIHGLDVAWYWPDAPHDQNAGPLGGVPSEMTPDRCVVGPTNVNGDVGFGMGRGAFYWPDQGQIGPHACWVHGTTTRSELVRGLGMVGGTNHDHFDVEYLKLDDDAGPVDPPVGEVCPVEEILAELDKIESSVRSIRQMLQ